MIAEVDDGPEKNGLSEVGRLVRTEGLSEAPRRKAVIPPLLRGAGRMRLVLLCLRQVKKGTAPAKGALKRFRGYAMVHDDEEADLAAGRGHLSDHSPTALGIAPQKRADIDGGNTEPLRGARHGSFRGFRFLPMARPTIRHRPVRRRAHHSRSGRRRAGPP